LDIDLSTQNLQECCAVLNEFALPRALVDFERRSFVAWNVRFLEETGYSEEDIKSADAEELLTLGDSWYPIPDGDEGKKAEIVSCTAKRRSGASPSSGYVVRAHGNIGYVMLEVLDSQTAQFEEGRIAGREAERNRIIKAYHEEVASSIIAALFLAHTAKRELEEAGLPQAETVSKVSEVLTETTEKIADVLLDRQAAEPT
jgi:hypothetical protein